MDELLFDEFKKIFENNFLQISFKKHCDSIEKNWDKRYNNNHPTESMHEAWAKYVKEQIFV